MINEETLKKLIIEMEQRVTSFEQNMELLDPLMHSYWDGKRSEAAFMVEKLKFILDLEW
jgi:hypothetical protein